MPEGKQVQLNITITEHELLALLTSLEDSACDARFSVTEVAMFKGLHKKIQDNARPVHPST